MGAENVPVGQAATAHVPVVIRASPFCALPAKHQIPACVAVAFSHQRHASA
jgi:hypothetical protein